MACNTGVHYEGEGLCFSPEYNEQLKGVNELTQKSKVSTLVLEASFISLGLTSHREMKSKRGKEAATATIWYYSEPSSLSLYLRNVAMSEHSCILTKAHSSWR